MLSFQIKTHWHGKFLPTPIAFALVIIATLYSSAVIASETRELIIHPGTSDPRAIFCVIIFILSYLLVMTEEATHLRKSKPVILGAGIIWAVIGYAAPDYGVSHEQLKRAISHDLNEYGSLFLFLFAAMTYIGDSKTFQQFINDMN